MHSLKRCGRVHPLCIDTMTESPCRGCEHVMNDKAVPEIGGKPNPCMECPRGLDQLTPDMRGRTPQKGVKRQGARRWGHIDWRAVEEYCEDHTIGAAAKKFGLPNSHTVIRYLKWLRDGELD